MEPDRFVQECLSRPALVVATVLACIGTSGAALSTVTAAADEQGYVVQLADESQTSTAATAAEPLQRADKKPTETAIADLQEREKNTERAADAEEAAHYDAYQAKIQQEKIAAEQHKARLAEAEKQRIAKAKAERLAKKKAAEQKAAQEKAAREKAARERAEKERKTPATGTAADAQKYAKATMASQYGWGSAEYTCLLDLWNKESRWRWNAKNAASGAYGIPQSLPGHKMATAGKDWRTNYKTQVNWGLKYIDGRYGKPCAAWAHSVKKNWY